MAVSVCTQRGCVSPLKLSKCVHVPKEKAQVSGILKDLWLLLTSEIGRHQSGQQHQ